MLRRRLRCRLIITYILTATNDANCAGMIKIQFPNFKVEYSIDYGDTPEHGKIAKEELKKLIEQFVGGK